MGKKILRKGLRKQIDLLLIDYDKNKSKLFLIYDEQDKEKELLKQSLVNALSIVNRKFGVLESIKSNNNINYFCKKSSEIIREMETIKKDVIKLRRDLRKSYIKD